MESTGYQGCPMALPDPKFEDHKNFLDNLFSDMDEEINSNWEKRKITNQTIGEDKAQQHIAFVAALDSQVEKTKGNKFPKYYWITINPKPEVLFPDFKKIAEKVFSKKWISSHFYVYEMADKFHLHGLIRTDNKQYAFARAKKEFVNSLSGITNVWNTEIFIFREINEELAKEKIMYMLGHKTESKMDHVFKSMEWRWENDLEDYYAGGHILSLLPPSESPPPVWDCDPSADI